MTSTTRAVEAVAIPTCARPDALERCVRSHATAKVRIFVGDDTKDAQQRGAHRRLLAGLAAETEREIVYLGDEEKRTYIEEIAKRGAARSIVDALSFVLLERGTGSTAGSNRNALALAAIDLVTLFTDDDSVARASHPRGNPPTAAARIISGEREDALWVFETRKDAFEFVEYVDILPVELASRVVTHPVAALIGDDSWPGAHGLPPTARVRTASFGHVGDSGGATTGWALVATGESRKRLATDEAYRVGRLSRAQYRSAPMIEIGPPFKFSGGAYGIDLRVISPPTFPYGKGQDVLFSEALGFCGEGACAYLPWAMIHDPLEDRPIVADSNFWMSPRINDLIRLYLLPRASRRGLPELGEVIVGASRRSDAELLALARDSYAQRRDRITRVMRKLVAEYEGPDLWRSDVATMIERLAADPLEDGIPVELRDPHDQAASKLRAALAGYGHAISVWEEVWTTARAAASDGLRLGALVG